MSKTIIRCYRKTKGDHVYRVYWNKPSRGRVMIGTAPTPEDADAMYQRYLETGEVCTRKYDLTKRRAWVVIRHNPQGGKRYELHGADPGEIKHRYLGVLPTLAEAEKAKIEFVTYNLKPKPVYARSSSPTDEKATRKRVAPTGPRKVSQPARAPAPDRIAMLKAIWERTA